MKRDRMFLRMLLRAALVRPGRVAGALAAVVIAATVSTAVLNLYTDVQSKLEHEFRAYGANIAIVAPQGESLPANTLQQVNETLGTRGVAVPFAYAIARTVADQPIVVAGTDFQGARRLNSWWEVKPGWPQSSGQALVGTRAAEALGASDREFELRFEGKPLKLTSSGTLHTGAAEDSRVYMDLGEFQAWTGVAPATIEVSVSGSAAEVEQAMANLRDALPQAEVRPVRQIVEAEGRVLGKTRGTLLAASALILITAALCVLTTLTAWVLDRRKDFAVMKALGASERLIAGFFAAEAAAIGATGALVGFAAGIGIAMWIGRTNFHAPVEPRLGVLPLILLGSVALALVSAMLPVSLLRRIQPAAMLRGE
jgi:putative ABC transport system permease protein